MATINKQSSNEFLDSIMKALIYIVCYIICFLFFFSIVSLANAGLLKLIYKQTHIETLFLFHLVFVQKIVLHHIMTHPKIILTVMAVGLFLLAVPIKKWNRMCLKLAGLLSVALVIVSILVSLLGDSVNLDLFAMLSWGWACLIALLIAKFFQIERVVSFLMNPEKSFPKLDLFNNEKTTYGSAEFLSKKDENKLLNRDHTGLLLDGVSKRLSEHHSFQNVLVCAPTGVGKTQTYIIPNILSQHDQSLVITDPSGEVYEACSNELMERGYEVVCLNPFDSHSEVTFNPLQDIQSISDSKKIGKILTAQIESTGDPFWHISASAYISAMLLVCHDYKESLQDDTQMTFHQLKQKLILNRDQVELLFTDNHISESTVVELKAVLAGSSELFESIRSLALTSIELFSDEHFKHVTRSHTLKISKLRQKKMALFVSVPEHKLKYSASFISLFYAQLFDTLMDDSKGQSVYVYLEEFANIGKIPDFQTIITTSRKRRLSISLIVQDIEQIEKRYKNQLNTIVSGGCLTKIFYSSLSQKSAQFASDLCGKKNQETQSKSTQTKGESETESETGRNLVNPDEIRRLEHNQALVIHGNYQPILMTVVPNYERK